MKAAEGTFTCLILTFKHENIYKKQYEPFADVGGRLNERCPALFGEM
jgi:hypothetical protein